MTPSASAVAEAEQATIAYQMALARMGASTIAEAILLWRRVNPAKVQATASAWLDDAVQMILSRRGRSRDLAIAYYRLVRALRTGSTIPSPYEPVPTHVTLKQLRAEFAALVDEAAPKGEAPGPEAEVTPEPEVVTDGPGGDEEIPIDEDLVLEDLEKEIAAAEAREEQEAREALEALGSENLSDRLQVIDKEKDELSGKETDERRDKAHQTAGSAQAAGAAMKVQNGARDTVWALARSDAQCIGFIRLSIDSACGFCTMLLARGPVYYSRASAEFTRDGQLYHPNCNCVVEPVFSFNQYRAGGIYATNLQYEKEWPEVTKGFQGRAALNAWRRHVMRRAREARRQPQAG